VAGNYGRKLGGSGKPEVTSKCDLEAEPDLRQIRRRAGGERKEIGPGTQASFSTGEWAERFDPEGPKNPKRERRLNHPKKKLD